MKKLIITMGALAMFSLVAQAVEPLKGDVDFDDYEVGAGIPIETQENGFLFWAGNNGESIVTEEKGRKFLKVDTTEGLQRKTTADEKSSAEEGADKFNPADIPGDGGNITISSEVQFTAAEDAPTPDQGDKLIVWAKAPTEEGGAVKLMVTDKTGAHETGTVVAADTWYNLQIVSVATGAGLTTSTEFTVKISQGEDEPVAVTVGGEEATFVSCLRDGDPAAHTIESVGFKGTGAVDNIAFTKEEGIVVEKFDLSVSVDGEDVTMGMTYAVDDGKEQALEGKVQIPVGSKTVTVKVAIPVGYRAVGATKGEAVTIDETECYYYTIVKDVSEAVAADTVTITVAIAEDGGEEPEPVDPTTGKGDYADADAAAEAAAAINEAKGTMIANPFEGITDEQKAPYISYIEAKANGTAVEFDFTEEGKAAIQPTVDAAAAKVVDILNTEAKGVEIEAVAGFYYYLVGGTEVTVIETAGKAVQATGAKVTLPLPTLNATDKAFFRVKAAVMNPAPAAE